MQQWSAGPGKSSCTCCDNGVSRVCCLQLWLSMCVSGASYNCADLLFFPLRFEFHQSWLQPASRLLVCLCGRTYRRELGTVSNTYNEQHTCGQYNPHGWRESWCSAVHMRRCAVRVGVHMDWTQSCSVSPQSCLQCSPLPPLLVAFGAAMRVRPAYRKFGAAAVSILVTLAARALRVDSLMLYFRRSSTICCRFSWACLLPLNVMSAFARRLK